MIKKNNKKSIPSSSKKNKTSYRILKSIISDKNYQIKCYQEEVKNLEKQIDELNEIIKDVKYDIR